MTNQRSVANSNSNSASTTPSVPQAPPATPVPTIIAKPPLNEQAQPLETLSRIPSDANLIPPVARPAQYGLWSASQLAPARGTKVATPNSSPDSDAQSTTAAPPHVCLPPPAHTLANALKAVKDGVAPGIALHDHTGTLASDSPYAKSISSTAPGSPRL